MDPFIAYAHSTAVAVATAAAAAASVELRWTLYPGYPKCARISQHTVRTPLFSTTTVVEATTIAAVVVCFGDYKTLQVCLAIRVEHGARWNPHTSTNACAAAPPAATGYDDRDRGYDRGGGYGLSLASSARWHSHSQFQQSTLCPSRRTDRGYDDRRGGGYDDRRY